jgi:hypothetical protein
MVPTQLLDVVEIDLGTPDELVNLIDVYDNSLSRKWLAALNDLLINQYHLEKNYCFFGFATVLETVNITETNQL